MWLYLVIIICISMFIYIRMIRPLKYWTRLGVPQGKPKIICGDIWGPMLRQHTCADMLQKNYNISPNSRYCGLYNFSVPSLVIRDPDLIKQITVKDFDHFVDHNPFLSEDIDPLWGKNLFALTGQRWRDMRSTLSPTFTSSKIKIMFVLISKTAEQFISYFQNQNQEVITFETKDCFSRYTNDVIGSVAFGVECDSLQERNNEFFLMGKDATDFNQFWKMLKIFLHLMCPSLSKYTGVSLFSTEVRNFFKNLITDNITKREKHHIVRPDMIHLLMETRQNGVQYEETSPKGEGFAAVQESEIGKTKKHSSKTPITDEDITAQALLFFFAGFETISSQMLFLAYELALNPDIQNKLIQEIDETAKLLNADISYEVLLGMKYLDMVVSEGLRKWPTTIGVDRLCTKPYTIEAKRSDEVPIHLKPKDIVFIPIYPIHRDPQYHPDPERFDPERFNDENKMNINPFTFMPFGLGPRSCIGSRFALLEIKVLFFHILRKFEIIPVEDTEIPIRISMATFTLGPHDKLWLGLKRRTA